MKTVKANKKEILLTDLYVQMVVNVWYSNHYFKINFGIQDRLKNLANEALVLENIGLKIDSKENVIFEKLFKFILHNPIHSFTENL